jgi:trehalose 2-sulfotransferase
MARDSKKNLLIKDWLSDRFDSSNQGFQPNYMVCICSSPRSGSTLLADVLRQTNLLGVPMEYLNEDYFEQWNCPDPTVSKIDRFGLYLSNIIPKRTTPNGVFGIKTHFFQLLHAWHQRKISFFKRFDTEKIFYIHLSREDKIAQAVSLFRAIKTDQWISLSNEEPDTKAYSSPHLKKTAYDNFEYKYSFDEIYKLYRFLLREDECWEHFFLSRKIQPTTVSYENFSKNLEFTAMQILKSARSKYGEEIFPHVDLSISPVVDKQAGNSDDFIKLFTADLNSKF